MGFYGAAVAAKNTKNLKKAKLYFEQLLSLTENIESNRPEIKEANYFINQFM